MIHISQICNLVIKMTTGQIRYFWIRQKILDQSEAQISTINHLRLIFSPIFQKPEILTRPHFSIQTIFLPRHPVLFSIKRQYSHMVQSHNHHHHQQQTLHQLIYELKKIILEVFLIKMYVRDSKTKTFGLWKRCSRILVFWDFFISLRISLNSVNFLHNQNFLLCGHPYFSELEFWNVLKIILELLDKWPIWK